VLISVKIKPKKRPKGQNILSNTIEKAIMKVRKKTHNHIAYFIAKIIHKNKGLDASNIQSPDSRTEPHYKHIKMITDYRYSHTTYSELSKDDLNEYDCPKCGARHSTKYYSHYERHVISLDTDALKMILEAEGEIDTETLPDIRGGLFNDTLLDVYRVKCVSCNTTHAILPGDVVPYRQFGLLTMLSIVKVMYDRKHSIEKTAKHIQLSWQLMLALLNQWISHLSAMALLMRAVYQERINEMIACASQEIIRFVCCHRDSFPQNYQKEHSKIIFMTHSQIHRGRKIVLGMAANQ
jgi:hypothetical protein